MWNIYEVIFGVIIAGVFFFISLTVFYRTTGITKFCYSTGKYEMDDGYTSFLFIELVFLFLSMLIGTEIVRYIQDTPERKAKAYFIKVLDESTPQGMQKVVNQLKQQKEYTVLSSKIGGVCYGKLDSWSTSDYVEHKVAVMFYNRTVEYYQTAVMRNLHGFQYEGLNIYETLPKTIKTCRGEIV